MPPSSSSHTLAEGAVSQWNDANGRSTFVSQATAANRPVPVTDNTLAGPAKSLVDFGAFSDDHPESGCKWARP